MNIWRMVWAVHYEFMQKLYSHSRMGKFQFKFERKWKNNFQMVETGDTVQKKSLIGYHN